MSVRAFVDAVRQSEAAAHPESRWYGRTLTLTLMPATRNRTRTRTFTLLYPHTLTHQHQHPLTRRYLHSPLLRARDGAKQAGATGGTLPSSCAGGRMCHMPVGADLVDDLTHRVSWDWLSEFVHASGEGDVSGCSLWCGHGRGCTPLHFDGASGLLGQVRGRKRVLLFMPSASYSLYPHPAWSDRDCYSPLDVEQPDLRRFPAAARARGLEGTLEPGDALYLPSYVWHYVKQLDAGSENISLSVGFADDADRVIFTPTCSPELEDVLAAAAACARPPRPTEASDDARIGRDDEHGLRCLITARHVESLALEAMGGDGARAGAVLTALADGADATQTSAAIGKVNSESHLAATRLRYELVRRLGADDANALLRAMARGGRMLSG
jgi:hypothetical protein